MAKGVPTQQFVPLQEVRNGIAILKDGSVRAMLLTSSVNFALKSPEEQEALILQFQNLLNTLDFSLQIYIQSRRLDIRPYLQTLEERYAAQTSNLLKIQTREYMEFIRQFTDNSDIMNKRFFVVIPYHTGGLSTNPKKKKKAVVGADKIDDFEEASIQLEQRIGVVEQGLTRMGVRAVRLGTEEVIELFYKILNPGSFGNPATVGK